MKQFIACLISFILLTSAVSAGNIFADSYGNNEPQPTDLTINKIVKNPITNLYVENLGSTDPTFSPGSTVTFKLIIKNTSGETFAPVKVVDQLPEYLSYVSSSVKADYDAGQRRIVMQIETLAAGQTQEIEVVAKVADNAAFVNNRSFFCESNYATATAPARPNGDNDTAEFCITTKVGGATNLPVAGFNDLFTMIPFLSLGGIGLVLLKKK